jgi:hypothetical protein
MYEEQTFRWYYNYYLFSILSHDARRYGATAADDDLMKIYEICQPCYKRNGFSLVQGLIVLRAMDLLCLRPCAMR